MGEGFFFKLCFTYVQYIRLSGCIYYLAKILSLLLMLSGQHLICYELTTAQWLGHVFEEITCYLIMVSLFSVFFLFFFSPPSDQITHCSINCALQRRPNVSQGKEYPDKKQRISVVQQPQRAAHSTEAPHPLHRGPC